MDPINIIIAINLFVSMSANFSAAKKGMKSKLSNVHKKPKTYLQKVPPNVAAIVLVLIVLGVFKIGVLSEEIIGYRYLHLNHLVSFILRKF